MKYLNINKKAVDTKDTLRETADSHVINSEISPEIIVISVKQLQNFMDNVMKSLENLSARIQLTNSQLTEQKQAENPRRAQQFQPTNKKLS